MKTNRIISLLLLVLVSVSLKSAEQNTQNYRQEFKVFKKSSDYKTIFDSESPASLKGIQRDLENFKELSFLQRLVHMGFLSADTVIITPVMMPTFYAYIDGLCKQTGIKTPVIFITTGEGFFNAAATKLLMSSGAIIIGQKLLLEISDQELEAVLAHEIGHIKFNHINKILLTSVPLTIAAYVVAFKYLINPHDNFASQLAKIYYSLLTSSVITALIINKRFEKQADQFACETQHAQGIIGFFETILKKDTSREECFIQTYDKLLNDKTKLSYRDYLVLRLRYGLARTGDMLDRGFKFVYYNTPLGAHPSPEVRIEAAQEYLQSQLEIAV